MFKYKRDTSSSTSAHWTLICAVEAISFKALLALADSSHTGGVRRTVLTVQGRATCTKIHINYMANSSR